MAPATRKPFARVTVGALVLLLTHIAGGPARANAQASPPVVTLAAEDGSTVSMTTCAGTVTRTQAATLTVSIEPVATTDLEVALRLEGSSWLGPSAMVVVVPNGESSVTVELDLGRAPSVTVSVEPGAYVPGDPSTVIVTHFYAVGMQGCTTIPPTSTLATSSIPSVPHSAHPAVPLLASPQLTG